MKNKKEVLQKSFKGRLFPDVVRSERVGKGLAFSLCNLMLSVPLMSCLFAPKFHTKFHTREIHTTLGNPT